MLKYVKHFLFTITIVPGISAYASRLQPKTEHNFNDSVVRGQYQSSGEAIATVENEKTLNDLLSPRKDFKDRLKRAAKER